MPMLLTAGLMAFLLSLTATPLLRWMVLRTGIGRARPGALPATANAAPIPRLGGLAVIAAAGVAFWLGLRLPRAVGGRADTHDLAKIVLPALLVLLVGVADDLYNLAPRWKLIGQSVAAVWVIAAGIQVAAVLNHPLSPWLAYPITFVWLVGCTNAFNLIDGLDGLATGLALFATGTVLAHAVLIGEPSLALPMGVLFGALTAFLLFNFPPASVYLGDSGSLTIGFLLGCAALIWANKATTAVGLLAPLFALLVPVLDTVVSIVRRVLTGRPLFAGDLGHIHHRLLRRGFSKRSAVFVLYAIAGGGAIASLLLADLRQRHTFELVILLFLAMAVIGVQQLGYVEFSGLGRMLLQGRMDPRQVIRAQAGMREWMQTLSRADDYDAVWECLCQVAAVLDFHGVAFRAGSLGAPRYEQRSALPQAPAFSAPELPQFCGWSCHIPLGEAGELGAVVFWRTLSPDRPRFLDDMTCVLQASLVPRLQALQSQPRTRAAAAASSL